MMDEAPMQFVVSLPACHTMWSRSVKTRAVKVTVELEESKLRCTAKPDANHLPRLLFISEQGPPPTPPSHAFPYFKGLFYDHWDVTGLGFILW